MKYNHCPERQSLPCVDLLYDYTPFLNRSDRHGSVGTMPSHASSLRIAIVGAGISGLVAATELMRTGIHDVTLFEARNRIGGRAWSQAFDARAPHLIAEMGAMRFPSSQSCLFHYLDKFGISNNASFPDPGVVDTELHYRGTRHLWPANGRPPELFRRVDEGWRAFLRDGYVKSGKALIAPMTITSLLKARRFEHAREAWQGWIEAFGNASFYSAIVEIFSNPRAPGGVRWEKPADFDLFGSLGIGSGGFTPVYQAGFTEILRIVINGYDCDQRMIIGGISSLVEKLANQTFQGRQLKERVQRGEVSRISKRDGRIALSVESGDTMQFDRVIVTSSNRSMQTVHRITSDETFFDHDVCRAVRETHMTSSSKIFMLTSHKFWLAENLPTSILTDGLLRNVYCLDYEPDNPGGHGVVLLSYTWEDDANKLLGFHDKRQRCQFLTEELAKILPQFARHLIPADDDYERNVIQHDWLLDPYSAGAFKLNYPGTDIYSERLFFQFQSANDIATDSGLYLAGCGCSFTGGWIEGAIQTGLNSACAVIRSVGGKLLPDNPLDGIRRVYRY
ncbi:NAD(P)/FAD-dependent oxidoreductase [Xanthomonas arboricola]|uniref:NAD(P)/FAD-dependent oxidoreductase n=1 Tax=Xanthomonas arboricola TaxID=56448 RepID=UPI000CEE719D|nr:NAD(P)/FAD-dependent oxidoreductase [Xanthomonas arboricola]PPU37285.1 tryptophan 2-monooxygenase [Xanthomonas arboricola pv. populi]